jgi:hypothetical protein
LIAVLPVATLLCLLIVRENQQSMQWRWSRSAFEHAAATQTLPCRSAPCHLGWYEVNHVGRLGAHAAVGLTDGLDRGCDLRFELVRARRADASTVARAARVEAGGAVATTDGPDGWLVLCASS